MTSNVAVRIEQLYGVPVGFFVILSILSSYVLSACCGYDPIDDYIREERIARNNRQLALNVVVRDSGRRMSGIPSVVSVSVTSDDGGAERPAMLGEFRTHFMRMDFSGCLDLVKGEYRSAFKESISSLLEPGLREDADSDLGKFIKQMEEEYHDPDKDSVIARTKLVLAEECEKELRKVHLEDLGIDLPSSVSLGTAFPFYTLMLENLQRVLNSLQEA